MFRMNSAIHANCQNSTQIVKIAMKAHHDAQSCWCDTRMRQNSENYGFQIYLAFKNLGYCIVIGAVVSQPEFEGEETWRGYMPISTMPK